MFSGGYWLLGRLRGATVKLHWSIILAAFIFGGFRVSPGFLLAYPCLILVHELGHALVVWRLGHRVVGVEATGLGGVCNWSGNASPFDEALIAWGGVLAQLGLLIATQIGLWCFGAPSSELAWDFVATFTHTNLWLIAVNLMPIPPLDGAQAWTLWSAWRARGPDHLPYGTWRDHSRNVQRGWFDRLRRADKRVAPPVRETPAAEDGPLRPDAQQAIDQLLRRATGKARDSKD